MAEATERMAMYSTIDYNSPSQSIPSMTGNFNTYGHVSDSSSPLSYASMSTSDPKTPNDNISVTKIEKAIARWRNKHDKHLQQYKQTATYYVNESRKDIQRHHFKYLEDMFRKHQEFSMMRPGESDSIRNKHNTPNYGWNNNSTSRRNYQNVSFNPPASSYYPPTVNNQDNFNPPAPPYYQQNVNSQDNFNSQQNYYNYSKPNMYINYQQPVVNYESMGPCDSQSGNNMQYPQYNNSLY